MKIFSNQIELHYYFHDESHEIDAFFRNESEKELLILFQEIINDLDLRVRIESSPPKEGGFIEIWKFVNENNEIINLIVSVVTLILSRYPIKDKRLDKAQIENLELDNLLKKEELKKLGISYKGNIDENTFKKIIDFLLKNYKIVWRRSNFFKKLTLNKQIKKISIRKLYNFTPTTKESELRLGDYEQFILFNEDIPDIKDNEVTIDLISSVLKQGNFRWRGFLNGQIINFVMEDQKFKKLVFDGSIIHNNNVKLKVILNHSRKIDEGGQIRITKYYVTKVISYIVGGREYLLTE
ncbi:hypothetical protein EB1_05920 [Empedobacter brevis NBRC 14943 = ATCC 43319]|uniref:Uncharacterized protein n=1 Tax=Empedobacter brevis NBRC 14943 = ATCC 43319 TaxID=1218108 RepID=A0A511NDB6_9FLAO|nr:hypothetical protein [Empedobacter brevis]GEM50802.1 hypothetical protein EB1_05920 [Empedobacter brevis NBRC 14943 = ATCC 43319]